MPQTVALADSPPTGNRRASQAGWSPSELRNGTAVARELPPSGRSREPYRDCYAASLLALAPLAPLVATVATLATYFAMPGFAQPGATGPTPLGALDPGQLAGLEAAGGGAGGVQLPMRLLVLLIGGLSGLLVWLGAARLHWKACLTTAQNANARSFGELCQRVVQLRTRLDRLRPERDDEVAWLARDEAERSLEAAEQELQRPSVGWTLGVGYVTLWARVYRAEEALLQAEPPSEAIRGALYDELRLAGSTIPGRDLLLAKLRLAVARLSPSAVTYLAQPPAGIELERIGGPAEADDEAKLIASREARATLAIVRRSINDFRDDLWHALVRSRNQLLTTLTITLLATHALLALAIVAQPPDAPGGFSDPILGAAVLYTVGAVVGLFNRLYRESKAECAMGEYGLTHTRLMLTPVLSGLAAVGGVLVIALLPATVTSALVQPGAPGVAKLHAIYSLADYPLSLLLAAVFGLAPGLLIDRLKEVAERYRTDLKSTQASGNPGAVGASPARA